MTTPITQFTVRAIAAILLSCPLLQPTIVQASESESPPNIVFFLVDDLGWTDINGWEGPDGQRYDNPGGEHDSRYYFTPNVAKLRNEGIRFTNAYAACPFCGPSRASILTGKYPARIGFTNNNTHDQNQGRGPFPVGEMIFTEPTEPDLVRNLDPAKETTIARALKSGHDEDSRYLSCSIGKWHIFSEGTKGFGPEYHGFDYNIGGSYRGQPDGGNRHGWNFYRGEAWSAKYFPNLETLPVAYGTEWPTDNDGDFEKLDYLTDALTHRALEFIDLASRQAKPFFLYMSHYGVHSPMQAKRTDSNGDGRIDPGEPEVHSDLFRQRRGRDEKHEIIPPQGSTEFHTTYTYASMIKSIDESLGQIMDRLESAGLADNTVVFFYSDNGGVERNGFTSNHPLRSEKTHGYEGGTRVPLIIRGPGIEPNGVSALPVTGVDFFPTMLELAGIRPLQVERASNNGFSQNELDGVSLVPLFDGEASDFERENDPNTTADDGAIFWHVPHYKHSAPYSAIIKGEMKFIRYWEDGDNLRNRPEPEDGYFMTEKELYNLSSNLGESGSENQYDSNRPLAAELETTLLQWLKSVDAAMPTAVRRANRQGTALQWYSQWISKEDPSASEIDPIQQAIADAENGDTITLFPSRIGKNLDQLRMPKGVAVETAY